MDLIVESPHVARWGEQKLRCAIGRNGIVAADVKREGDGCTPAGRWAIRNGFFRADRLPKPETVFDIQPMQPNDAWCDLVGDPKYNQHVVLPYATTDECLWRQDHLYDIVFMLGYNDAPVIQGKGSAIFLHLARDDFTPSAGCVTLARQDIVMFLREAKKDSAVHILMPR